MGGKNAPKSPDPKETAAAQTATNVATATANSYLGNINQVTPDGTLNYTYGESRDIFDPTTGQTYKVPTTTVTQTLSPQQQAIKDQTDKANLNLGTLAANQSGRLDTLLGTPFSLDDAPAAGDPSSLKTPTYQQYGAGPQLQTSAGPAGDITKSYDIDFDTSKYEDALMQRINPQLAQSREALETKLINQGLQPGSEAYNRAIDAATRQENDARYGAILNAGQEQSRLAGLAANKASFENAAQQQGYAQNMGDVELANSADQQMYQNNTSATGANNALLDQTFNAEQARINAQNAARAQYLNEAYAERSQPINEISALLAGSPVDNPNFVPTQGQSLPNVDYAGLVSQKYQNDLAAYQQKQAGLGSVLGGIGSLFSLSDEDAKKDVKKVGGLYEYRYKGEPKSAPKRIGVMAQEVEKVRPDAVRKGNDGYRRVNYGALFQAGAAR
ncbi:hypothetical protein PMI07_002367 [Rhizobium sp. CF080]|uniref:tail fiber domain-containing protein n=1 Tax=Rhizobium sp. (strain CF080) TaxID=1144310 RepID=UPI0002716FCD|nr:tail fiber domain-containing protein [Rhizobium sp. CF080]EUB95879.1 hypothetical protein PMI07_002367 [Rhizobium sp. CF080]